MDGPETSQPGEQQLEAGEVGLRTASFALDDVWAMVDDGRLRDAPSVAALGLLAAASADDLGARWRWPASDRPERDAD